MKEKLLNLSISTKIILVLLVIAIVLATGLGIAFATHSDLKELKQSQEVAKQMNIPNVSQENITIEVSTIEETEESVIVKANSKIDDYKLYYYIEPIEITEASQVEEAEKEIVQITDKEYTIYEESIEILSNAKVYFKYESNGNYSKDAYSIEITNIKEKIEDEALENEMATEEELEKGKVSNIDSKAKYYIIVNYGSNVVTVYEKDADGNYTVPVKAMVCSCGTATPRGGTYKLTSYRTRWQALFGGVYGQYSVPIVGNILFHSVPYLTKFDPSSLEYWEYDKLGTSASAGCIRLTVIDAIWIYNNCGAGTYVEFSASAANPLGKPSARKISSYIDERGYDPTDPVEGNPWRNVKEPEPVVSPTTPSQTTPSPSTSTTPTPSETVTTSPSETTTPSSDPTQTSTPETTEQPESTNNPDPTEAPTPPETTAPEPEQSADPNQPSDEQPNE